jgi:hypothetical protein
MADWPVPQAVCVAPENSTSFGGVTAVQVGFEDVFPRALGVAEHLAGENRQLVVGGRAMCLGLRCLLLLVLDDRCALENQRGVDAEEI